MISTMSNSASMTLRELSNRLNQVTGSGDHGVVVSHLTADSRQVREGSVFFAVRGRDHDGHRFIDDAWQAGAAAVVAEVAPAAEETRPWLHVPDTRVALAELAGLWFGDPARDMALVGVTGTNGKTTTTYLVHALCQAAQKRCGLIGTVTVDDGLGRQPAVHTTPGPLELEPMLAGMRDNGCQAVAMEVSSHALDQARVAGLPFKVAVFTNLTQDHLDYHGSMEAYFEAKQKLFEMTAEDRDARLVIPTDDTWGRRLASKFENHPGLVTYGMGVRNQFRVGTPRFDFDGTRFELEALGRSFLVRLPLIGRFNVYNAAAALAVAHGLDLNFREAIGNLANAPQVPGRLELIGPQLPFRVFVDYAHTPDALENVLSALRALQPGRLITVFGCGGDRDRAKRPLMGAAAGRHSHVSIVTSDNPRGEEPAAIIGDIVRGMRGHRHVTVPDRREAIYLAIQHAEPRDVILIAGKGHETYQEIKGVRHEFDDREIVRRALRDFDYIP